MGLVSSVRKREGTLTCKATRCSCLAPHLPTHLQGNIQELRVLRVQPSSHLPPHTPPHPHTPSHPSTSPTHSLTHAPIHHLQGNMQELRVLRVQRDALDDQIQRLEWALKHRPHHAEHEEHDAGHAAHAGHPGAEHPEHAAPAPAGAHSSASNGAMPHSSSAAGAGDGVQAGGKKGEEEEGPLDSGSFDDPEAFAELLNNLKEQVRAF